MRRTWSLAALALPLALLQNVSAPRERLGPVRVRVSAADTTRTVVFRVNVRGGRVQLAGSDLTLSGDTLRVRTPALLELSEDSGQLTLTSESADEISVDIAPTTGARVPRFWGTGRSIAIRRDRADGTVTLSTDHTELGNPRK